MEVFAVSLLETLSSVSRSPAKIKFLCFRMDTSC